MGRNVTKTQIPTKKIQPVVKKKTIFIVIINLIVITHTPMIVGTGSPLSLR